MSRILGTTSDGGVEYFDYDEMTDQVTIRTETDVTPVIDRNKALQNDGTNGWSSTRELRHIASIPPSVQMVWKQQYGIEAWNPNHKDGVRRLLNDPDWAFLRTSGGRV